MARAQFRTRLLNSDNSFLIVLLAVAGINCVLWMLLVLAGMLVAHHL